MRRFALVGLLSLTLGGLVSPATAAAAAPPDVGDHGAQAQCLYRLSPYGRYLGAARLMRVRVQPPTLFSPSAAGQVGWRIKVMRSTDSGPWQRIFSSKTQKRAATPYQAADFTPLSARINSPLFIFDAGGHYHHADYRAVVTFYWYNADGSVARFERHDFGVHDAFRDGEYMWTVGTCDHGFLIEEPPAAAQS